jgi:PAS domain S-box-containing protein
MIGMLRPLVLAPGLIFDGRSVVLSLGSLFFGPLAALVMGVLTVSLRIVEGGVGALTGVTVIVTSIGIGLAFRRRPEQRARGRSASELYLFGIVVHVAMLIAMFTLPSPLAWQVFSKISLPVIVVYPLATVLIGRILSADIASHHAQTVLQQSEERYRLIAENTLDCIWVMDMNLTFTYVNHAVQAIFGYTPEEFLGTHLHEHSDNEHFRQMSELIEKKVAGGPENASVVFETALRHKEGQAVPVEIHGAVLFDPQARPVALQGVTRDITERKRHEAEVASLARFPAENPNPVLRVTADGPIVYANDAAETLIPAIADPAERKLNTEWRQRVNALMTAKQTDQVEVVAGPRLFAVSIATVPDHGYANIYAQDITRVQTLEFQLRQAQKMEAIGRLAGGVAHDFNNLLTGIMNYVELCRDELGPEHPVSGWLDDIGDDAQRSANLTRQLLAFARKQTIAPRRLDLNATVEGMLSLLRRLIGEDIDLAWMPGAELWPVNMDPGQLDQILANLCVNARDAIAGVGNVTIETANRTIDTAYCDDNFEATPGPYVMLAVSDDGRGMERETLDHVFEPFFTTKRPGKGTGLGLATVYGIVKQNGGFVNIYSEIGKGTTFRIYLPRLAAQDQATDSQPKKPARGGAGETVLLVEDEKSVRVPTALFLERDGYDVLTARNPDEAIPKTSEHHAAIDLLITDVVMPGMNGRDLAAKLAETFPTMKCLYISGYTANVIAHRGILDDGVEFLPKPFTREQILAKVREILDNA